MYGKKEIKDVFTGYKAKSQWNKREKVGNDCREQEMVRSTAVNNNGLNIY